MTYLPLKPITWPQDDLDVPDGFGGMPPVNPGNLALGQEFFCLSGHVDVAAGTPAGTIRALTLQTPQDGDFWCDAIGVVSWDADTVSVPLPTQDRQQFLTAMVSFRDQRTGRELAFNRGLSFGVGAGIIPINTVPINLFRKLPQSGAEVSTSYLGDTPPPSGFRTTGPLLQPICFTRQGGVEIVMTTLAAAPAGMDFSVWFGLTGWKEYAHASR